MRWLDLRIELSGKLGVRVVEAKGARLIKRHGMRATVFSIYWNHNIRMLATL